ncbi:MAG: hypothetical protein DIZ78_16905 [endosymbiont of Escarpia spicata]|uniref:CREG-like beta-barrel domain-containing protein n=1 Tax=endosymbiont of Escarpia spicata TaxID=2200908 RepID=A0A370DB27_9GAMM|nr:MAG: hypothetical protein DIZ78_16905 [endosymbiont of Escarpia spicata]
MPSEPAATTQLQSAIDLWRESLSGVLSTQSKGEPGFPFGSVVPFCLDGEGNPLLLLSHLAEHTKNLDEISACCLTVMERGSGDVQKLARLSCLARAAQIETPAPSLVERYFRDFPDTRPYFETLNFRFYRLQPVRFYFVGGFGAAHWFDKSRLLSHLHPETRL